MSLDGATVKIGWGINLIETMFSTVTRWISTGGYHHLTYPVTQRVACKTLSAWGCVWSVIIGQCQVMGEVGMMAVLLEVDLFF